MNGPLVGSAHILLQSRRAREEGLEECIRGPRQRRVEELRGQL